MRNIRAYFKKKGKFCPNIAKERAKEFNSSRQALESAYRSFVKATKYVMKSDQCGEILK